MSKSDFKSKGKYVPNKINKYIYEQLEKYSSFVAFLQWEYLILSANRRIMSEMSDMFPFDEQWNDKMKDLFVCLARSYAGENLAYAKQVQVIKNAMHSFSGAFNDCLESEIIKRQNIHSGFTYRFTDRPVVDVSIKGEVNSRLLLNKSSISSELRPGNLYDYNDETVFAQKPDFHELIDPQSEFMLREFSKDKDVDFQSLFDQENRKLKKEYQKEYRQFIGKKSSEIEEASNFVFLECSPLCDYAQKKWKLNRILPGVAVPHPFYDAIKISKYIYNTTHFKLDDDVLIRYFFDFRLLTAIDKATIKGLRLKPSLRFRNELLVDIQAQMSGHVNRPGVTSLE